jgi:hypothetical protein
MNSTIYRDITPCSLLKVNRRFGGIYRLHLQGRRINWEKSSVKAGDKRHLPPNFTLVSCLSYSSKLKMQAMFLRNVGRLSTDYTPLYGRRLYYWFPYFSFLSFVKPKLISGDHFFMSWTLIICKMNLVQNNLTAYFLLNLPGLFF